MAGVVVFDMKMTAQEISAAKPPTKGCRNGIAFNASAGPVSRLLVNRIAICSILYVLVNVKFPFFIFCC
jgi:hypothetical protein